MEKKKMAAVKATEYIKNNMILGLGTGSTAFYMIQKVGELVKKGLNISAVASSINTEKLAKELNIRLLEIDEVDRIDLVIDGVDEIDYSFNAIKGGGGALFREKIIASLAVETIWILDESKLVGSLGTFPLPIEILQYGYTHIIKRMGQLSLKPKLREQENRPYVTDNGNYIVDLHIAKPLDIDDLVKKLSIPGVLETGLFLNMCSKIIVGTEKGVSVIENINKKQKVAEIL
jgi:ribose 5-phosphate isomerase A